MLDIKDTQIRLVSKKKTLIFYQITGRSVLVVPFHFFVELAITLHLETAHIGRDKLVALLTEQVYHSSLYKVAQDVATICVRCQPQKVSAQVNPPPTLRIINYTEPM